MAPQKELQRPSSLTVEERLRALEMGHDMLTAQIAEMADRQQQMDSDLEKAIERGIENAFVRIIDRAQQKAAEGAGRWLWSTLVAGLTRWAAIALIVLMVGKYAGLNAAQQIWDVLTGKGK